MLKPHTETNRVTQSHTETHTHTHTHSHTHEPLPNPNAASICPNAASVKPICLSINQPNNKFSTVAAPTKLNAASIGSNAESIGPLSASINPSEASNGPNAASRHQTRSVSSRCQTRIKIFLFPTLEDQSVAQATFDPMILWIYCFDFHHS